MAREFIQLHEIYGDVVRVAPNELHFGTPSAFHDIYNVKNKWDKEETLYKTPGVRFGPFASLTQVESKASKDPLQAIFTKSGIQSIEEFIWQNANYLASAITRTSKMQTSIDMLFAFRSFTFDTMMSFTLGRCMYTMDAPNFMAPILLATEESLKIIPLLRNFPLIRKVFHSIPPFLLLSLMPVANKIAPTFYFVRAIILGQQNQAFRSVSKSNEEQQQHPTVLHRLLYPIAYRNRKPRHISKLYDDTYTLALAGITGVSDTLIVGLFHLLEHPQLLARLKAEILSVWADINSTPSVQTLESLPLLTAVIKESLRLGPGDVALTRVVPTEGAVIAGHNIPGGAIVGMAVLHVHRCEEIFKEAPKFNPDRWLCEESKSLDYWLVSFSRGPRRCLGINLAWTELYIIFAMMIRRFDMEMDGTTAEDMVFTQCLVPHYHKRHLHAWCKPDTGAVKLSDSMYGHHSVQE